MKLKHLENRTTNPIVINVVKEKKMDKTVDGYTFKESIFQKDSKDLYENELKRMTNKNYTEEEISKQAKGKDLQVLLDNLITLLDEYKNKLEEAVDNANMYKKENEILKKKLKDTIDDRNDFWKQKTSDDYKSTCDHCKATTKNLCHRCSIGWKLGAK